MKRLFLAAIIFILPMTAVLAQDGISATELFLRANKQYEAGDFSAAIDTYEQLINLGVANSTVYYNLGNAYFKNGDLGHAILNYRRAQLLSPRDDDIRANLALARSKTTDNIHSNSASLVSQLATSSEQWFTMNELAWGTLVIWILLAALIIAISWWYHPVAQRILRYSATIVAILFLASAAMFASRTITAQRQPAAIIVAEVVDVTSGPGEQYITEFTLHSGTEVIIKETRGKWVRLSLPGDQLQGWVPTGTVEPIAN